MHINAVNFASINSHYTPYCFRYNGGIRQSIKDTVSFGINNKRSVKVPDFKNKLAAMGVDIKTCTTEQVFDCLNIEYEKNEDGQLSIYKYKQPSKYKKFWSYAIKEDDLLNDIVEIKNDAYFADSNARSLGSVKLIGGSAYFQNSKLKTLNDLECIGKDAYFQDSRITSLAKLKCIEGNAYLKGIKDLGELEYVGGDIWLEPDLNGFGNLKHIGGTVHIYPKK